MQRFLQCAADLLTAALRRYLSGVLDLQRLSCLHFWEQPRIVAIEKACEIA